MTSLQIDYFLKVAESMSFSKTADTLFVSQPSVSRQIQQLEKELGYQLFDRKSKKMISLTPAGIVFRDAFSKAHQSLENARQLAGQVSDSAYLTLRVGVGAGWDLSAQLEAFRDRVRLAYPNARLEFVCESFQQLHRLLNHGELDVVLCTKTSIQNYDALETAEAGALESRVYVRKNLLNKAGERLCAADFQGCCLLMPPEEEAPMSMEIIRSQFLAHRVSLEVRRVPNRESILQMVLMGQGITVFDQYMYFKDDPRLDHFRLEDSIPICAAWRNSNKNPLIRLFAEFFVSRL